MQIHWEQHPQHANSLRATSTPCKLIESNIQIMPFKFIESKQRTPRRREYLSRTLCCDWHIPPGWKKLSSVLFKNYGSALCDARNECMASGVLNEFALCGCCRQWIPMVWMWFSMSLHAVNVALNEFAWWGCCFQWICMVWMLLSMNGVNVAFNEFEWCECCSQLICMVWMLLSIN